MDREHDAAVGQASLCIGLPALCSCCQLSSASGAVLPSAAELDLQSLQLCGQASSLHPRPNCACSLHLVSYGPVLQCL